MLKLFTLCVDTCINALYKTVFYSVEGFGTDPLTFSLLSHLSNHQQFVGDSGKQQIIDVPKENSQEVQLRSGMLLYPLQT